jgi:hypothetical protein
MFTKVSLCPALPGIVVVACLLLSAASAFASALVPGIPGAFPELGAPTGHPNSAVRASITGSASALSSDPTFPFAGNSFNDTLTVHTVDYHGTSNTQDDAIAESGPLLVSSHAEGHAGFGKLRAQAIAYNGRGGYSSAAASTVVDLSTCSPLSPVAPFITR